MTAPSDTRCSCAPSSRLSVGELHDEPPIQRFARRPPKALDALLAYEIFVREIVTQRALESDPLVGGDQRVALLAIERMARPSGPQQPRLRPDRAIASQKGSLMLTTLMFLSWCWQLSELG